MPPLIIPPGFAQATIPIVHASANREAVVTFGVDMGAFAGTDAAAADAIQLAWNTRINPILDSQTVSGPTSLIVGQDGTENTTAVGALSAAGTDAQTSTPANVALLITKRTARGGRRGRGRMFLPWAMNTVDVSEGGIFSGTALTTAQTAFSGLRSDLITALLPMFILHTEEDTDPDVNSSPPGLPNAVTSLTVEGLISTQRRRLGR